MLASHAAVTTTAPARYAKQLVSHLGRKVALTATRDGFWTRHRTRRLWPR